MQALFDKLKEWRSRRFMVSVGDFAHANKHLLIIVADPKDNTLVVAYKDKLCGGIISSEDGSNLEVVKNVLKASKFDKGNAIDRLLTAIALEFEVAVSNKYMQEFLKFIDGALYRITKALKHQKDN